MDCSKPGLSLLKLTSIESVMPFNDLILCCPLLVPHSVFPRIRVFSKESILHIRCPKYWSFSISPSNEYPGLISFDLLEVQGTVKSFLQHHGSKHHFFGAQPSLRSNSHIHTQRLEKTIAVIIWTFVRKVMCALQNTV